MKGRTTSPLVIAGKIAVDGAKFPALPRALERGRELSAKEKDGWAQVAELRRTGQSQVADQFVKDLLGVKGPAMPEEVKAALRERRAAMTGEEKRAEREERRANRVLRRLAARAAGNGTRTQKEDPMATKTAKKSKAAKSEAKAKSKKNSPAKSAERDPRLPVPGSTITREYKKKTLEVKVLDAGFEFEGQSYPSLTALALKITGAKAISGPAFFKLTEPKPVEAK